MQYVDRKLFLSLVGRLDEAAISGIDLRPLAEEAAALDEHALLDWIERRSDVFSLAGMGSSRIAVAVADGRCLKLVRFPDAVEQQRQEIRNCAKAARLKLNCFPEMTDWDRSSCRWLVTRLCTKADADDFERMFGYGLPYLMAGVSMTALAARETGGIRSCLRRAIERVEVWDDMTSAGDGYGDTPDYDVFETLQYYVGGHDSVRPEDDDIRFSSGGGVYFDAGEDPDMVSTVVDVMKRIDSPDSDCWRQLRRLVRFASTSFDSAFSLRDCWTPGNWGLALVDGKALPMVVDSGYCPELEGIRRAGR